MRVGSAGRADDFIIVPMLKSFVTFVPSSGDALMNVSSGSAISGAITVFSTAAVVPGCCPSRFFRKWFNADELPLSAATDATDNSGLPE